MLIISSVCHFNINFPFAAWTNVDVQLDDEGRAVVEPPGLRTFFRYLADALVDEVSKLA